MGAVVRLPVKVTESLVGADRAVRMYVETPASFGTVLISASNLAPHRAAVFLYLAEHDGHIGPVELVERVQNTAGNAVWHFVATLELRDDR